MALYSDLYTDPNPPLTLHLLSLGENWKLSQEDCNVLMLDVTLEEVRSAVFGMSPNKSPCIDIKARV